MSGSKILLDTNIVLYLLSDDETLAEFLDGKQAFISSITELELIGFLAIKKDELLQIRSFLRDCEVVSVNDGIKEVYI